ncbi:hypothetical protein EDB19DRAFT_1958895 [Suillus lakei]|nr:hypothetical protein EDB19DRAFT_1958895 [Suillus lakei]
MYLNPENLLNGIAAQFGSSDQHKLVKILRKIWDYIVDPVVQALRETKVHPGSRICQWWCPTTEFTLLPLRTAGPYEKKRDNLSYFYISSYTPTVTLVLIGQTNPDRGKELQCVAPLAVVAERLAPVVSFTSLEDSHPVMECSIANSYLEFAFLSACHTTVGDEKSPDELIHLAAAMQFSGFRSVVGSMWSVDHGVARQVVSAFYSNLFDGSGRLDCTRAAAALHKAVNSLRKKIPLEQQIVFVHIGVWIETQFAMLSYFCVWLLSFPRRLTAWFNQPRHCFCSSLT